MGCGKADSRFSPRYIRALPTICANVWYLPDGKAYNPSGSLRAPFDSGLEAHCASRGLVEVLIRRRTIAVPNIRFESGCMVRDLVYRNGSVRGVLCFAAMARRAGISKAQGN